MRYFIHLGFDGTDYRGWQRQKDNHNTVQEVIEQSLSQLLKQKISVYGCGRTDAGVHASQYILQFYIVEALDFDLKFRLNKNLPESIAIYEIIEVGADEHCRNDATSRTYDYFIHLEKGPSKQRYSSFYDGMELNFPNMQAAKELIRKNNDFRPLCKQPDTYNDTLCEIGNCELYINEGQDRIRFTITANRFLRGMVRICVFFLLEVGRGELTIEEFADILNQKREVKEFRPAYANGLFLSRVEYPFLALKDSHNLIKMMKIGLE